jgi:hypothetical protein
MSLSPRLLRQFNAGLLTGSQRFVQRDAQSSPDLRFLLTQSAANAACQPQHINHHMLLRMNGSFAPILLKKSKTERL